jgi:hypothetical protein
LQYRSRPERIAFPERLRVERSAGTRHRSTATPHAR